jgi:hypothetical protein
MSSTWRNKETNNITHKSGIPITSPPENFKNIPMFEVLHPKVPSNDPSVTKEFTEEVTEGFDIMGDDYFESCKRYIRLKGIAGISDFIKDKFKLLYTNPVDKLDESIEDTIYSVLYGLLLMTGEQCKDDTLLEKQTKDKAFSGFWWIKGYGSELFTTMQEAFSVQDSQFTITVDSFKKNHPEFITDNNIYNKVVEYYVSQLNERETKLKRRINDTELFQFNNYFDNQLNLPEVQSKILKIKTSTTTQTIKTAYRNTMSDYQKYYKNTARFKIYNKESILYYTFDNTYYTFDNTYFDLLNTYFDLLNNKEPPTPSDTNNPPAQDTNYAFSINFKKTDMKTVPIQSFLEDVLTHYTSILVKKKKTGSYKDNILKSRIGTVYTKLLNYLEFQFYRKYGVFFNEYHLALFNHIFFILLNQDDTDAENVYNGTTNDYFNFGKQQMTNIYQTLFKEILSDESSKLSYLYPLETPISSGDNDMQKFYLYDYMLLKDDEMLPTDGVMLYPVSISPTVLNSDNANVLIDYILLPEPPFEVDSDMKKFYREELSPCEKEQEKKKKKIKGYAKTIKEELYKILLAPVTIYIAYNFYYLFFFKDCTESVKTYNETTGDTDYKNTCEKCTTPIFPDVETYFHYYEEHKLDLLFELFFKPVKFLYTLANSLKAIFRNEFSLLSANAIVPKDEFPYIFLFACIIFFYNYLIYDFSKNEEGNYKYVLSIFNHIIGLDFDKLNESVTGLRMDQLQVNKTEDIESILKKGGIAAYVFMITILFFTETMIHHIGGVSIKSMFNNIATKAFSSDGVIDSDYKKDYENSWLFWVTNTTNPLVGILKFLYMLFYWFLKGFIVVKLIPLSITIVILYFIYNLFVGIYNNSTADVSMFDKFDLINRTIYTKLYSESSNTIMFMIKSVFWFVFFYLYEFIAILVLIISLTTILKRIDSNVSTVISMFFLFFIVGIVLWCAYKYKLIKPKLDDDYMRYDNSKQFNMFNCKDEYEKNTDNNMLNIFVASDTYNKDIIDEYMEKRTNEIINKKPSGLQKSFGSMVNFFGDKMNSAKSFLEDKTANVESTIGSGLTNVKDLLASKAAQTKDGASKLKEVAYKTPSKLGEVGYKLGEGALYGSKALGEGALNGAKALGEGALNGAKALGEGALNGAKSLATGFGNLFSKK